MNRCNPSDLLSRVVSGVRAAPDLHAQLHAARSAIRAAGGLVQDEIGATDLVRPTGRSVFMHRMSLSGVPPYKSLVLVTERPLGNINRPIEIFLLRPGENELPLADGKVYIPAFRGGRPGVLRRARSNPRFKYLSDEADAAINADVARIKSGAPEVAACLSDAGAWVEVFAVLTYLRGHGMDMTAASFRDALMRRDLHGIHLDDRILGAGPVGRNARDKTSGAQAARAFRELRKLCAARSNSGRVPRGRANPKSYKAGEVWVEYAPAGPGDAGIWTVRTVDGHVAAFYDIETGYPRQGGSGRGAALKRAMKLRGYRGPSDVELARLLKHYGPHEVPADYMQPTRSNGPGAPSMFNNESAVLRRNGLAEDRAASREAAERAKHTALAGTARYSLVPRGSDYRTYLKLEGYGFIGRDDGRGGVEPENLGWELPRSVLEAAWAQATPPRTSRRRRRNLGDGPPPPPPPVPNPRGGRRVRSNHHLHPGDRVSMGSFVGTVDQQLPGTYDTYRVQWDRGGIDRVEGHKLRKL